MDKDLINNIVRLIRQGVEGLIQPQINDLGRMCKYLEEKVAKLELEIPYGISNKYKEVLEENRELHNKVEEGIVPHDCNCYICKGPKKENFEIYIKRIYWIAEVPGGEFKTTNLYLLIPPEHRWLDSTGDKFVYKYRDTEDIVDIYRVANK